MRAILDSHVFLWAITDDERLTQAHRDIFLDDEAELYLSIASLWEILIKCGIGKLGLPKPAAKYLSKQLEKNRIGVLGIQLHHLARLEDLPPLHRDPFDRMIAAQAIAEKMPVLTVDEQLSAYGVQVI
jgi:PIN domain nuclease of toxin-antitoxin system